MPSTSWRKNGFSVKYNSKFTMLDTGGLRINGVESSDAGDYTCTASNDFGSDSTTITVYVLGMSTFRLKRLS